MAQWPHLVHDWACDIHLGACMHAVAYTTTACAWCRLLVLLAWRLTRRGWLTQLGGQLSASVAFPLMLVLQELEWAILHLPDETGKILAARTSIARVGDFLLREEVVETVPTPVCGDKPAVSVRACTFQYVAVPPLPFSEDSDGESGSDEKDSEQDAVSNASQAAGAQSDNGTAAAPVANVTLDLQRDTLTALVGDVGAGKSSLLKGLLGEVHKASGSFELSGTIAYCPQEVWLRVVLGQLERSNLIWCSVCMRVCCCCCSRGSEAIPSAPTSCAGWSGMRRGTRKWSPRVR